MSLHFQLLRQTVALQIDLAPKLAGKSIYITGASGFLASSLVVYLDELRRQSGVEFSLHASARRERDEVPLFRFLGITPVVNWAVSPAETCVLPRAERSIVVHTASYGAPADYMREPIATYTANTDGLLNLFRQHERIAHLVYFSSAEIYGQPPNEAIPTPESYVGGLPTLSIRSIYGESKRMAEVLGCTLGLQHQTPFTALRPWNIYGPGQRLNDGRVPMEFIRQARALGEITLASNGTPSRGLCYVWDGISQIARTLLPLAPAQAYNIGNDSEEVSMLELARKCAAAAGLPVESVKWNPEAKAGGLQRCAPCIDSVRALAPGDRTFISLDQGLQTLVEWHHFLSCLKN